MFRLNPLEIDKGIFISSMPRTVEDVQQLSRLGIRKALPYTWGYESLFTPEQVEKHGVQANRYEMKGVGPKECIKLVRFMRPHTVLFCEGGNAATFFACVYWVRRGLSPKDAEQRIRAAFQKAKVPFREPWGPFRADLEEIEQSLREQRKRFLQQWERKARQRKPGQPKSGQQKRRK